MAKRVKKIETPDLNKPLTPELLGQAIRARRTQSELRLTDAAALCGVAKQTLINLEHGQASCHLGSLLQVCAGLGIKLNISPWTNEDSDDWR